MAMITLRQLLDHAAEHGYGVPAFNINNMEQGLAIMEAARACDAPVILQASRGARSYAGDVMLAKMIDARGRDASRDPDLHAPGPRQRRGDLPSAIQHGFTSVMMDGSLRRTPRRRPPTTTTSRSPAGSSRWRMPSASRSRASSACLGSLETGEGGEPRTARRRGQARATTQLLTDPDQAADFVARDRGRRAGDRDRHQPRRLQVLAQARRATSWRWPDRGDPRRLPNTHLVMHGSSSVPQELQDIFNAYGGEMPQTWGVPVEEILRGIRHGVRKVNIDTDCRMAMTAEFRRAMADRASSIRASS